MCHRRILQKVDHVLKEIQEKRGAEVPSSNMPRKVCVCERDGGEVSWERYRNNKRQNLFLTDRNHALLSRDGQAVLMVSCRD